MGATKTGIWRYDAYLPTVSEDNRITLGEGNTPLVKSRKLGQELGLDHLYFKMEGANPTGSYKDRIAAMGVSWALEQKRTACVGTTSGNAGASIAAYAARAGIPYHLLVLEHILPAKLLQVIAHGAQVRKIEKFGESAEVGEKVFTYIEKQAKKENWEVLITAFKFNENAMQSVKTISYELYDDLAQQMPDAVFVPVGGGGLFTGIAKGFEDLAERHSGKMPQVVAVQSAGCNNIIRGWEQGSDVPEPGDSTSQISGLQVPNSIDADVVLNVLNRGDGWGESVPDPSTWEWQEKLADEEGILVEPAAAISLAGVAQAVKSGRLQRDSVVVCILSGAGYKDMNRLQMMVDRKPDVPLISADEL